MNILPSCLPKTFTLYLPFWKSVWKKDDLRMILHYNLSGENLWKDEPRFIVYSRSKSGLKSYVPAKSWQPYENDTLSMGVKLPRPSFVSFSSSKIFWKKTLRRCPRQSFVVRHLKIFFPIIVLHFVLFDNFILFDNFCFRETIYIFYYKKSSKKSKDILQNQPFQNNIKKPKKG